MLIVKSFSLVSRTSQLIGAWSMLKTEESLLTWWDFYSLHRYASISWKLSSPANTAGSGVVRTARPASIVMLSLQVSCCSFLFLTHILYCIVSFSRWMWGGNGEELSATIIDAGLQKSGGHKNLSLSYGHHRLWDDDLYLSFRYFIVKSRFFASRQSSVWICLLLAK